MNDFNNDFNKLLNTIEYFCKNYISRKYLVLGLGAKKRGINGEYFRFFLKKYLADFFSSLNENRTFIGVSKEFILPQTACPRSFSFLIYVPKVGQNGSKREFFFFVRISNHGIGI